MNSLTIQRVQTSVTIRRAPPGQVTVRPQNQQLTVVTRVVSTLGIQRSGRPGAPGKPATQGAGFYIPGPIPTDDSPYLLIVFDAPVSFSSFVALADAAPVNGQTLTLQKRAADGTLTELGVATWGPLEHLAEGELVSADFQRSEALRIPPVVNPDPAMRDVTMSLT